MWQQLVAIYLARPATWQIKIHDFFGPILAEITYFHRISPPRILGRLLDPSMLEQLESQTSEQRHRVEEILRWGWLKTDSSKVFQICSDPVGYMMFRYFG